MAKTNEAKIAIENAAENAVKVIAAAAGEAAKVVANAAAEATKIANVKNADDHDLLIELKTKMDGLKEDIRGLTDGTSKQIADHEKRIKDLEACKIDPKAFEAVKTSKLTYYILMTVYTAVGVVMIGLILWHIFHPV